MNDKSNSEMDIIYDMIRYQFVDINIMSQAIRDCNSFRNSTKFKEILMIETYKRIKKSKSIFEVFEGEDKNKFGFDRETINRIDKFRGEKVKERLNEYTDKSRKLYSNANIKSHDLTTDISDSFINNNFYKPRKREVGKVS